MSARPLLMLVDESRHDAETCARRVNQWCAAEQLDLEDVLHRAEALVHEHPVAARELASAVRVLAQRQGRRSGTAPATTVARAALLEGQVLAIEGHLDAALAAVDQARDAFVRADAPWRALRADLGRMHILNELGQGAEAIRLGTRLLHDIAELESRQSAVAPPPPFAPDWLRASCLTNLAVCHTFAGDYEKAADANGQAERCLANLGRWDEIAILRQNQGEQLLEEGRARDARQMFAEAVRGFSDAGLTLLEARCLADLGRANSVLGEWSSALEAFARAEQLFQRLNATADVEQVRLRTAEAYLGLNLYEEAALVYERVVAAVAASGLAHYHAIALNGRGAALAGLGRWDEAQAALEESADRHERAGNLPLATAARVEVAAVLNCRGERTTALELLRRLRGDTEDDQHQVARVYVLLGLADVAPIDEAIPALLEASTIVERLGLPPLRFRVDSRLGSLRRRQNRLAESRVLLERAAAEAELQRALLPSQLTRTSFLRDKARPFDELVALELDETPSSAAAAFLAAERAKCRSLLDVVQRTSKTQAESDQAVTATTERLFADLSVVYDEMLGSHGDHQDTMRAAPELRPRSDELDRRARALQVRLSLSRLADGGDGQLPQGGRPCDHDSLRERLGPDTVVLAYHVVDGEVIGFRSIGGQLVARRITTLAQVRPLLGRLEQHWRRLRAGPAFAQRHATRLSALIEHDLHQLARQLLDPLPLPSVPAGSVGRLAVVAPPQLHAVPFHALPLHGRPLVTDWEIVTAPSGSVLAGLPRWRYDPGRPSVALATVDPTIPHAESEVRALAGLLPGLVLRVGAEATASALRTDCPGAGIVHLACHGLFRPDNAVFSALRLADGWMTAGEAATLDLTGAFVTLSACETGRQQAIGGEAVGLSWAMLAAGAAAVLTSLWMADDDSASGQMQNFYRRLRDGATPAAALRGAQLDSARRSSHAYYWAPFTVTGAF